MDVKSLVNAKKAGALIFRKWLWGEGQSDVEIHVAHEVSAFIAEPSEGGSAATLPS